MAKNRKKNDKEVARLRYLMALSNRTAIETGEMRNLQKKWPNVSLYVGEDQ